MKLYATIQNSKGKREGMGDNDYLEIDLNLGNKLIGRVVMGKISGEDTIAYYPIGTGRTILYSSGWKGKKQKGECSHRDIPYGNGYKCIRCGRMDYRD